MINVADYGATGNGTTDDRASICLAIDVIESAIDRELFFPPGRYRVSKYVPLVGVAGLLVRGQGATILYQSADSVISTDGVATSDTMARSGFLAIDCDDLMIRDLAFEGDRVQADITINIGCGVYMRNCARPRLESLKGWFGGALFQQEAQSLDHGLVASACYSYGARNPCVTGSDAIVRDCAWELPATVDYDRIGSCGSSHAVYLYAGRSVVSFAGCTFRNIRTAAIKVSGSALPIRDIRIVGCEFYDCGSGVVWGADQAGDALHATMLISDNIFSDCGTNRPGWTQGAAVVVYGSRATVIRGNLFRYTRGCLGTLGATRGIQAQRYQASRPPCEDVMIEGNSFVGGAGVAPGSIVNAVIYGSEVSGLFVRQNTFSDVGAVGIYTTGCARPVIEGNLISNSVTAIQSYGDTSPLIVHNRERVGLATSSNPTFRMGPIAFKVRPAENWRVALDGTVSNPEWLIQ